MELLEMSAKRSLSWENPGITLRFFKHYSKDTIEYIQKKIIPNTSMEELKTLAYFYSSNN